MVRIALTLAIAALTSYGTTSHRYTRHTRNVFSVTENARDHQGGKVKDRHRDLCHRKLFMKGLLRRDDGARLQSIKECAGKAPSSSGNSVTTTFSAPSKRRNE